MNAHWGQIPAEWWHGGEDDGEETIVGSGVTAASRWATSERRDVEGMRGERRGWKGTAVLDIARVFQH
jgi:hypothetical protein